MSPSSASMSVACTRRSTFRPETWASSKSTTRRSPLLKTSIHPDISGASRSSQHTAASTVPTLLKLGSLGTSLRKLSADYDSVARRTDMESFQEATPSEDSPMAKPKTMVPAKARPTNLVSLRGARGKIFRRIWEIRSIHPVNPGNVDEGQGSQASTRKLLRTTQSP